MKNNNKLILHFFLSLLACSLLFIGCTPQKELVYLQKKKKSLYDSTNTSTDKYLIRSRDNIFIQISSPRNSIETTTSSSTTNTIDPYFIGYNIDDSGFVQLPLVGNVLLKGHTISEAKKIIEEAVKQFVSNAVVNIKMVDFKITLLGEVNRPGTYYIKDTKINILEALGQGNDLTHYGNRHRVMVIREDVKGQKSSYYIDLTDKKLLYSDLFYVLPNDVIYVEPNRTAKTVGFAEFPWSIVLSAITTTLLLMNYIKLR